jgi:signal transduction histidine kinase
MGEERSLYNKEGIDYKAFKRLRIRYIIGLSAIAITLIFSESLVKRNLKEQLHDSRVVNVAGRQRMLSQKITKICLLIERDKSTESRKKLIYELKSTLHLWTVSHKGLRYGDDNIGLPKWKSKAIDSMYVKINGAYENIVANAVQILNLFQNSENPSQFQITQYLDSILAEEPKFLVGMDQIVFRYDKEAHSKVDDLIKVERFLLVTSLFILLCELIFIFTPIALHIRKIIAELINSEAKEKQMNIELRKLNQTLELAQKDLESIYFAVDWAIMFARTDLSGNVLFISDKFLKHLGLILPNTESNILELLQCNEQTKPSFEVILQKALSWDIWKDEIQVLNSNNNYVWLNITFIPVPDSQNKISQLVVVCVDINDKKIAEELLQKAAREKYNRKVAQQKLKSSFILEGQEKERRRIFRELHDGVGQLLTGLKFQMESIDEESWDKNFHKIEYVKTLTTDIIREVRRVSYNLTPSGLNDYGFVPALNTLVQDIKGLTSIQIKFENITGFNKRLDKNVEINLFRIVQESLNNALKYSKADNVLISLAHENKKLMIVVEDDGVGFNLNNIMLKDVNKMTRYGILNMKERAGFIKADLDIDTSPGSGTVIKIELKV